MFDRAHIFVLNHNGRALLEECLPSVLSCARSAATSCRVTVVDNASSDDSIALVRRAWPEVAVLPMPNRGLVSFNEAVTRVDEPVVLLLNNDVRLELGCVDRLAAVLNRHDDAFLAGPLCWTFDGKFEGTRSELRFDRGLIHTRLAPDTATSNRLTSGANQPCGERLTASAGAALAVRRDRFLALGGFDPLFLPGRFEDLDLAFRGWLAGWKALYVPDAVAWHRGSATFGRELRPDASRELDARNALLFAWKNLRDPRLVAAHLGYLALRLARAAALGQTAFLCGFAQAVRRLPLALGRRATAAGAVRSDRELLRILRAEALN